MYVVKLVSSSIDGQQVDANIAQYFSKKYKWFNLSMEVDTNNHEYDTLLKVINNKFMYEGANGISDVSVLEVTRAVNKLKLNKCDCVFGVSSNGFEKGRSFSLKLSSALSAIRQPTIWF